MDLDLVLISLAFTAGLFTFISPCTLAVFPIYIAHLIGLKSENPLFSSVLAGFLAGLGASFIYLILGISSSFILMLIMSLFSSIKFILALILIGVGILSFMPGWLTLSIPVSISRFHDGFYLSSLLYGVIYAFASLPCSYPVFLMIIFTSASSGGLMGLIFSFMAYALGLIIPLTLLAVITVYSRNFAERAYSRITPHFKKLSGLLLIGGGLYLMLIA